MNDRGKKILLTIVSLIIWTFLVGVIVYFVFGFDESKRSDMPAIEVKNVENSNAKSKKSEDDISEQIKKENLNNLNLNNRNDITENISENTNTPYNYTEKNNKTGEVFFGAHNGEIACVIMLKEDMNGTKSKTGQVYYPQGVYKSLGIYLKNISAKSYTIDVGQFYLIDDRGKRFPVNIDATKATEDYVNIQSVKILNPGEYGIVLCIYDIPVKTNITKVLYSPSENSSENIELPFEIKAVKQ